MTVFFAGLYWLLMVRQPRRIALLGFDHDYDRDKVEKWKRDGRPGIGNKFNGKTELRILDWSARYYAGYKQDFFYGHGTPDPMRFPVEHLIAKFRLAVISAEMLGVELVNFSPVVSSVNIIQKSPIPTTASSPPPPPTPLPA